jgi:hypothetical protein
MHYATNRWILALLACLAGALTTAGAAQAGGRCGTHPWCDTSLSPLTRADMVLAQMTTEDSAPGSARAAPAAARATRGGYSFTLWSSSQSATTAGGSSFHSALAASRMSSRASSCTSSRR